MNLCVAFSLFIAAMVLSCYAPQVEALSLDPVASSELDQCIRKGDCVISMRHIRPRRKLHISIEALFMIDFPTLKHKLSFFLDRKQHRVTLDIGAGGVAAPVSHHFAVPAHLNETSTLRSLALHFQGKRVALLVDCAESDAHELPDADMGRLYTQMEEPIIKLFRERKYPLHFDSTVTDALLRANCQRNKSSSNAGNNHRRQNGNRRLLRSKSDTAAILASSEKNKKRDVHGPWYYKDHNTNNNVVPPQPEDEQPRGDIPVMHGDCEDAIAKSLSDLLALIKLLREDISQQRQEITYLRHLLENCAGCKAPPPTPANIIVERPTCRTANPCYPNVECFESLTGLRCGRCPSGMIGDGKICKPGISCADKPCFVGVYCRDTVNGAQCDGCPLGYEGDGRSCKLRNPCVETTCNTGLLMPSSNLQSYQRHYTRKYSVVTS